ncbi:MAG: prolyl oligopeptidase family serine peptidase, partial [Verrucomicrobiales bacterium]|nr:prolyl oligopeptidase family serine peptidase [Verrucomicrobiales bacterium]
SGIGIGSSHSGDSYGRPEACGIYTKFHKLLTTERGLDQKACLLARSRGGLMLYKWAADNPTKVTCIAGIYPVCDLRSYPGLNRAAPAYGMKADELEKSLKINNPVEKLKPLADAKVPIFHIHGNVDRVVPLKSNSGDVAKRYQRLGGKMHLVVPNGQGHNMWKGFFYCQELVDFVITHAKGTPLSSLEPELIWEGGEFTEGPAVGPDGSVLFSDVGADTIYKFSPENKKVNTFRERSGRANGLIFDPAGNLIACEGANTGGGRRISVTSKNGKVRTLTKEWQGKRVNSPNDLAIDNVGKNIYFTDPRYVGEEKREIEFEGIFMVRPDGSTELATKDVKKPNGIIFSKDGKKVFVADHEVTNDGTRQLLSFSVTAEGKLENKQTLHDFGSSRGIDGMALGPRGNIFATAGSGKEAGIYVFEPGGNLLQVINLPGDPTNCTFGHEKNSLTLYVTAQSPKGQKKQSYALYRLRLDK